MRTFNREHFLAARQAWIEGQFSDEWRPYRAAAALAGYIYPPEGTKWDSWADDQPSQRAMLVRAMRECPQALMKAVENSGSWSAVIGELLRQRDFVSDRAYELEAVDREERREEEPTRRQAVVSVGAILKGLGL